MSLHHYVASIADTLGVPADTWYCLAAPAEAYIAFEQTCPRHPGHDVALLWTPRTGWCTALEVGGELTAASCMGGPLFPPPHRVAAFAAAFFRGDKQQRPTPRCPPGAATRAACRCPRTSPRHHRATPRTQGEPMTTRDDLRAGKALQGLRFPADRARALDYARVRAADRKTLKALEALPDRTFATRDDLVDAVPGQPEGTEHPGGTAR
ncbi:DUF6292 family protein [Tomitella cavernea]